MNTSVKTIMLMSIAVPVVAWAQPVVRDADTRAVEAVLSRYKNAIEKLDASGTEQLFTTDARIFETGSAEGTYATYLAHHLGPELGQFKSFRFSDYKVDVRFEGSVALATETYRYRIEPKTGQVAERIGVATSVLKKVGSNWKIVSMHNSGRKPKGS
jgi:ketosteroid isomerase-like protein